MLLINLLVVQYFLSYLPHPLPLSSRHYRHTSIKIENQQEACITFDVNTIKHLTILIIYQKKFFLFVLKNESTTSYMNKQTTKYGTGTVGSQNVVGFARVCSKSQISTCCFLKETPGRVRRLGIQKTKEEEDWKLIKCDRQIISGWLRDYSYHLKMFLYTHKYGTILFSQHA